MARLVISAVIVALGAGAVFVLITGARKVVSFSRSRSDKRGPGGVLMKQVSFVLLVALILYAAIWGAG